MPSVPIAYRRCWKAAVLVLTGAVLVIGLLLWHSDTPMTAFLTVSVVTLAISCGLPMETDEQSGRFWARALGRSAMAGAVGAAVVMIAAIDPRIAFGIVVVAAVTSPLALAGVLKLRARSLLGHQPGTGPAAPRAQPVRETVALDPDLDAADLDGLSDEALCHAWRRSFVMLERAASVVSRTRVVAHRQLLLEELEHRHPEELQAWFDAGGRAASGPERFLRPGAAD
jgi:hypothetical protein